jgi:hypothetical protein
MKSNQTVEYIASLAARTVTARMTGKADIVVSVSNMHAANVEFGLLFGIQSRLSNAAAIDKADKKTGIVRSAQEVIDLRHAALQQIADHLNSGSADWDVARAGGGVDNSGLTMEAIARVYFKSDVNLAEQKVTALADKKMVTRKEMLATYANIPDVAAMMGTIRAERAQRTGIDAVALADELANA